MFPYHAAWFSQRGRHGVPSRLGGGPVCRHDIAERWRRVAGTLIDAVLAWLVAWALAGDRSPRLVADVVGGIVAVVGVALWGRTFGKALVRTVVVAHATGAVPGLGRSVVRWAVPMWPVVFGWLLAAADVTLSSGWIAVLVLTVAAMHAPVLWGQRRSIPDRLAGTIVVSAPSRTPSPPVFVGP